MRITADQTVSTSTQIAPADYNGVLKGVCSFDGTGYWLAGNASNTCVGYVAQGSAAGSGNFQNAAHDAFCSNYNGLYTGCTAVGSGAAATLLFTRTLASYGLIDTPNPTPYGSPCDTT